MNRFFVIIITVIIINFNLNDSEGIEKSVKAMRMKFSHKCIFFFCRTKRKVEQGVKRENIREKKNWNFFFQSFDGMPTQF